jgi:hypothetical protein
MDDDFYITDDRENADDLIVYVAYKPKTTERTNQFPPTHTRYVIIGTSETNLDSFICLIFHKFIDDTYSTGELCVLSSKKIIKNLYIDGFISKNYVIEKAHKECLYYSVNQSKKPWYGLPIELDTVEDCMQLIQTL